MRDDYPIEPMSVFPTLPQLPMMIEDCAEADARWKKDMQLCAAALTDAYPEMRARLEPLIARIRFYEQLTPFLAGVLLRDHIDGKCNITQPQQN